MSLATSKYRCDSYTIVSGGKKQQQKNKKAKCASIINNFVCKTNKTIFGAIKNKIPGILGATTVVHYRTSIVGWHCM